MSRVTGLDAPTEARSIAERQASSGQALDVITANLWTGVGLGNYSSAAGRFFEGAVRVHNVPLLVTAELGLPALLLWFWLAAAPFWYHFRAGANRLRMDPLPLIPSPLHAWIAVLLIGLFDTTIWLTGNWQSATFFALILAHFAQDN